LGGAVAEAGPATRTTPNARTRALTHVLALRPAEATVR
jgi:hypothetical protein